MQIFFHLTSYSHNFISSEVGFVMHFKLINTQECSINHYRTKYCTKRKYLKYAKLEHEYENYK